MSKKETHLSLLPNGFVDLLPPEAGQEAQAISTLMNIFSSFGYERIKPPLVEFEESLLAPGPGAALSNETFRLMDPVSHSMMGIRSDITPQIARIASSRLAGEVRPLRLCYANDVLRTRASQQRTERQFCQAGCEIIGAGDAQADIETCVLALLGLDALGLEDLSIDLALPQLAGKIFDEAGMTGDKREKISEGLERRSRDILDQLDGKAKDQFAALLNAGGAAEEALAKLEKAGLPASAKDDMTAVKVVYQGLQKALSELELAVSVTIDPLESKGFEYHERFGFTVFAKNVRGELGRGGRYNVYFGADKKGESATGFTLYLDTVRKALPPAEKKNRIGVAAGESWAVIRTLQNDGYVVVRGGSADCTHIYKSGKVEKI